MLTQGRGEGARLLCFRGFALLHSPAIRGPLYAVERLTAEGVARARGLEREGEFHEEERLPAHERARLEDYVRSGLDRGHLAPAGDMPDALARAESFSLANVLPQEPGTNRFLWSDIEIATRSLAVREGELYVVTGPVFAGPEPRSLKGRVLVPTHLFKAVYLPGRGVAAAYLAQNAAAPTWRRVSLAELQTVAGIDAFPGLPPEVRATAAPLPEPGPGGRPSRRPAPDEPWLVTELRRLLPLLWRDLWRAVVRAVF